MSKLTILAEVMAAKYNLYSFAGFPELLQKQKERFKSEVYDNNINELRRFSTIAHKPAATTGGSQLFEGKDLGEPFIKELFKKITRIYKKIDSMNAQDLFISIDDVLSHIEDIKNVKGMTSYTYNKVIRDIDALRFTQQIIGACWKTLEVISRNLNKIQYELKKIISQENPDLLKEHASSGISAKDIPDPPLDPFLERRFLGAEGGDVREKHSITKENYMDIYHNPLLQKRVKKLVRRWLRNRDVYDADLAFDIMQYLREKELSTPKINTEQFEQKYEPPAALKDFEDPESDPSFIESRLDQRKEQEKIDPGI